MKTELKKEDETLPTGEALLILATIPVVMLWQAFVLQKVWTWFMADFFDGVQTSVPIWFGVLMIFGVVNMKYRRERPAGFDVMFGLFIGLSYALLAAWVVHLITH